MKESRLSKMQKIALSAVVAGTYIAVTLLLHPISFGIVQIRIGTALYALGFLFPFLIIPMGLANGFVNLFGTFGILDVVGGVAIGVIATGLCALVGRLHLPRLLVVPALVISIGFIVPTWLSWQTGISYWFWVLSIGVSQIPSGVLGYGLLRAIESRIFTNS